MIFHKLATQLVTESQNQNIFHVARQRHNCCHVLILQHLWHVVCWNPLPELYRLDTDKICPPPTQYMSASSDFFGLGHWLSAIQHCTLDVTTYLDRHAPQKPEVSTFLTDGSSANSS